MKTQIKRFSKSALAVVLTLCMLVSCMTVGIIATDAAQSAEERVGTVDNSENLGANTGFTSGSYVYYIPSSDWVKDSARCAAYFYGDGDAWSTVITSQTSGTRYRITVPGSGKTFTNVIFVRLNKTATSGSWDYKWNQTGDLSYDSSKNCYTITGYGDGSWSKYVPTSSATLSASPTSITTAETSTLTPGISGNTTYNAYKSVSYSINPSSGASISGNTFSATTAGSYTVTATVTYNAKGFPDATETATKTATITVTAPTTCTLTLDKTTKQTINIGETFDLTVSSENCTGSASDLSITSSSATYVSATLKSTGTNSRTYTIKALKPTSSDVTLTAACSADSDENNPTLKVAVNTPAFTLSYSPFTIYTGGVTATPTVAIKSGTANASSTSSSLAYTITSGSDYGSINTSTGVVTSKSSAGTVAAKVTGTITYNGVSYTTAAGTANVTVSNPKSIYFDIVIADNNWGDTNYGGQMTYDHAATLSKGGNAEIYKLEVTTGSSGFMKNKTYYIRTWDGSKNYRPKSQITSNTPLSGSGVEGENNATPKSFTTTNAGTYTFYYDYVNHKFYVEYPAAVKYNITYPTTTTGYTLAGTQPATAAEDETVSFTVTPQSGYRIKSVKYTPTGGSATNCTAGSNNEYHFTMPNKAVTVSVEVVQQFSVALTTNTGVATKKYKLGSSGTYQDYSSALTVDSGTDVYFKVTYTTGYEYASNSGLTQVTAGTEYKTGSVTANKNVAINAQKISWSGLTAVGKYSTTAANDASYSNDFPAGTAPNVTIAATSATQLDGVAVTAPGTDPTGYVFAGWYTTTGSFANPANKDTTFYPNAANAVAIAKYKKIFTITSSVDNTGTGAGTVTTSKTSVEAGGSYTITATAKSGSAIESVKVNGTAKTATASQTISSVSADQTVSVKFASKPHVIGKVAAAGWTEPGDAMKSNETGTEFTFTRTELAAGTYDFQHYIGTGTGGTYDSTSTDIATKTISGGATLSSVDNGYGGKKFQLVLTAKSDVTLVSNGSKFTAITVRRSGGQKYNVTFKKVANTTITGTYLGTPFTTASADAVVEVYSGDDINFTVTPDSDKYISGLTTSAGTLDPAFAAASHGNKYEGKTNVTSARTITPTVGSKLTVSAKTNKSDRGTVTVDNNTAYPGQKVKVTVSPKNGVLKTLTYTYGTTTISLYPTTNSSLNATKLDVVTVTAVMYDFFNKSGEALGAAVNDEAVGADSTYTFTMPSEPVTVNATFDSYSAEANYYYSGYDTGGNNVNGYDTKRLTESIFGGEKFAYYHVEGRTDVNQLFTIFTKADQQGYVYFTQPSAYGYWSKDQAPKAYFWNDNGTVGTAWPGTSMTSYDTDNGQNRYRIRIPDGATHVKFSDGSSSTTNQTTHDITLQTGVGGYYLGNNAWNNDAYTATSYTVNNSDPQGLQNGTVYYNYKDDAVFKTGKLGFTKTWENWNVNNNSYARPNEDMSNKDYYIIVLYPGKTYKVGDKTYTVGSTYPAIFWSAESPVEEESVKVFAKDGSIRSDSNGATYANIADTKIYAANGTTTVGTKVSGTITNQTYETYKVDKGETIVIKTTIGATDSSNLSNAAALKAKYYVRGFCVNGEVSELLDWNADGVYTLTYKVPEDYEGKNIEITPIYYLKDTTANPIVTYRVTGFTDELKAVGSGKPGWGDTLYTYPFYGKLGGQNNAFGAYPGQPMVYYKGQYQMQIPQKSTAWDPYGETAETVNNTNVAGVTMSNGYWDSVHKTIMGYGDNSSSADHVQTYDYGDFYKIFNEKAPVDNIVFDFKYRTAKHNLTDIITTNTTASALNTKYGTGGNGFELLTNFHGRNVDLFGTPLSGEQLNATPVYVVSTGGVIDNQSGVENIAGYYATEWVVYGNTSGTTYHRITGGGKNSIPPEVLVLNDDDTTSFNTTTYPSAVDTTAKPYKITDWKALYTALEAYRGKPVYISYEAADAQQGQEMYYTGSGGATRNDGRWLYSKNGENITSKIKIQYSNDNGETYTDLNTTNPQVTGLSAYFTNDGVEGQMTYSTTIDPDKTFDFEAKTTNGNYKFVGWFMEDGTKITTDNASHTERSGSYTFVAKFMKVESGQLILSHSVDTNNTYKGAGTAKISAVVKNGDEVVRTYDLSTSDITLDDKIIKSDSTYTIEVTLEATATGSDVLGPTVLANPSGQDSTYFTAASTTTVDKKKTIVLNSFTVASLFSGTTQNVKNIIYHSYFTAAIFHYKLKFEYKDRFGKDKVFYRDGNLTSAQAANTDYVERVENGSYSTRYLRPAFIETIAPHVSNFGETITWNLQERTFSFTVNDYYYNCDHYITATTTANQLRNVTFNLPYAHNNGIAIVDGNKQGTAAITPNFELTGDNAVTYSTIPTLLNEAENGIYTEADKKNWIAAPATINDNGTTKYFQYWSVKKTSASGENDPELARCYFQGFNFVVLDDYTITAVYDNSPTSISDSGIYTGASYLETSRNQWNDNTNRTKDDRDSAADLLFNDFVLNYNYKGVELYKNGADAADVQELGVVVERIRELDINQDGSKNTNISNYSSEAENKDTVLAVIKGTSSDKKFTKNKIEKTALDNKNRYQFYDAFYNGAGWSVENQSSATKYAYKNYVFRAYTYIKYKDDQGKIQIKLSDTPTYFTMYDEAVKDYVAPKTSSTNP